MSQYILPTPTTNMALEGANDLSYIIKEPQGYLCVSPLIDRQRVYGNSKFSNVHMKIFWS